MVVNAVYAALLIGNIVLIVASLLTGPRLLRLCRAAAFVNVIALVLMVVPLLHLLLTSHPPAQYRAAVNILLAFIAPILIELLALWGFSAGEYVRADLQLRWRRSRQGNPPGDPIRLIA